MKARLITFVLTLAALAGTSLGFTTAGANAALSSSVNYINSGVSCNTSTRTMYLGGEVVLNNARFPNGALVSNRYRYYWVNASGIRTTAIYATAWKGPQFIKTYVTQWDYINQASYTADSPKQLYGDAVAGSGRMQAIIDVAVWNGSSYEYTSARPGSYVTAYWVSPTGWKYADLPDCHGSF